MFRRTLLLGALSACCLLVAGNSANADYSFATSAVTLGGPPTGIVDSITPNSGTVAPTAAVNRSLITIVYNTLPTTPVSGSQTFQFTETVQSTVPAGPANVFTIAGTFNILSASAGSGVAATVTGLTITPATGANFSLAFTGYSNNNGAPIPSGDFGFNIVPVPEPSSMALIGIGLTGLLGYGWRRREVARRLAV